MAQKSTAGERDAEIVVARVGVVPDHKRTRDVEVADMHEVAVRRTTRGPGVG